MSLSEDNLFSQNVKESRFTEALHKLFIADGGLHDHEHSERLKDILQNSWRFDQQDYELAMKKLVQQKWTVSSLTNAYLGARVNGSLRPSNMGSNPSGGTVTLMHVAINSLFDKFAISEDTGSDLSATVDYLPIHLL